MAELTDSTSSTDTVTITNARTFTTLTAERLSPLLTYYSVDPDSAFGTALSTSVDQGLLVTDTQVGALLDDEGVSTTFLSDAQTKKTELIALIDADNGLEFSEDYKNSLGVRDVDLEILAQTARAEGTITENTYRWAFEKVPPRIELEPSVAAHLEANSLAPLTKNEIFPRDASGQPLARMSFADQAAHYGLSESAYRDFLADASRKAISRKTVIPSGRSLQAYAKYDEVKAKKRPNTFRVPGSTLREHGTQAENEALGMPSGPAKRLASEGLRPIGVVAGGTLRGDEAKLDNLRYRTLPPDFQPPTFAVVRPDPSTSLVPTHLVDEAYELSNRLGLSPISGEVTVQEYDTFLKQVGQKLVEIEKNKFAESSSSDEEGDSSSVGDTGGTTEPEELYGVPAEFITETQAVLSGTVAELETWLETGLADPYLGYVLTVETENKNRVTATSAIEARILYVREQAMEESRDQFTSTDGDTEPDEGTEPDESTEPPTTDEESVSEEPDGGI